MMLWKKQGCRDLYTINYRSGGLAAKICKIQKQCSQIRKSLRLDLKRSRVGLGWKDIEDLGGFLQISIDTKRTAKLHYFAGLDRKSSISLLLDQIACILGHERAWDLGGKKEDDEGVPFYTLLTAGMHRGDQNLAGKEEVAFYSWRAGHVAWLHSGERWGAGVGASARCGAAPRCDGLGRCRSEPPKRLTWVHWWSSALACCCGASSERGREARGCRARQGVRARS
jgi:hypothetical protein